MLQLKNVLSFEGIEIGCFFPAPALEYYRISHMLSKGYSEDSSTYNRDSCNKGEFNFFFSLTEVLIFAMMILNRAGIVHA